MIKESNIENSWLLHKLTDDQKTLFLSAARKLDFQEGELIMEEGELGNSLFILSSGEVNISQPLTLSGPKQKSENVEHSISKLKASNDSNFFGEMSFIAPGPRSATVKATTPCEIWEITTDEFHKVCKKDPVLGYQIIHTISLRLTNIIRKTNKNILKLTTALAFSLNR